jgi:flavin reductase (DIM6/NTAB) family NADH-FMN oxidoreductase RutF
MAEPASPSFSARDLRDALGLFPTGVAVITATVEGKDKLGATVSSFNSVSLDPPLILFSIARSAKAFDAWNAVEQFGVNLLAENQNHLSTRFARALTDKWEGTDPLKGAVTDAPLLRGSLAWFECTTHARYDGGDHLIILGRVLALRTSDATARRPLVFCGSRYRQLDQEREIETPLGETNWIHGW